MKGAIILSILVGLSLAGTYLSITKVPHSMNNAEIYEVNVLDYKQQVEEYNIQGEDKRLEYKEQIADYENQIAQWEDQSIVIKKDIPTMPWALASLALGIIAGIGLKFAWIKGRK